MPRRTQINQINQIAEKPLNLCSFRLHIWRRPHPRVHAAPRQMFVFPYRFDRRDVRHVITALYQHRPPKVTPIPLHHTRCTFLQIFPMKCNNRGGALHHATAHPTVSITEDGWVAARQQEVRGHTEHIQRAAAPLMNDPGQSACFLLRGHAGITSKPQTTFISSLRCCLNRTAVK